jgi:hypothetical protein
VERGHIVLVALAAANVGWLLASAGPLVSALYLNADIASAPVISSLLAHAPAGRVVTLGNYPWYEPFWFFELTRGFPWHRQLWEAAPFLVAAADLSLLVWMAWRALGPRAALITGSVLACTTHGMRFVLFTPNAHGGALFHGVLLGAALVFVSRRGSPIPTLVLLAGGVVLSVLTAVGSSDRLLVVDSLVPFVLTAWVCWWRTRAAAQRMVALVATYLAVLALLWDRLAETAMRADHVAQTRDFGLSFVSPSQLFPNVAVFTSAFSDLGGGDFFGARVSGGGVLSLAAATLTLAAGAAVVRWCWRAAPNLLAPPRALSSAALARETYVVFWSATLLCTVAAFLLTSAPQDVRDSRYLAAAFVAVVALLPVVAPTTRRARLVLLVAVSAYALLALHASIDEGRYAYGTQLTPAELQRLERYAQRQHLAYGYADYATAPVVTWATGLRVQVFPVQPCSRGLCAFYLHTISSWYAPHPGARTFLLVDKASQSTYLAVTGPSTAFGPPTSRAKLGGLTIYVYDHDIAAHLGPSPG